MFAYIDLLYTLVQEDIAAIERWSDENFLTKPTKVQLHAHIEEESSHSSCNSIFTPQPHESIKWIHSSGYLGVLLAEDLAWTPHIICMYSLLESTSNSWPSLPQILQFFQCWYFTTTLCVNGTTSSRVCLPCTCVGTAHGQGHPWIREGTEICR